MILLGLSGVSPNGPAILDICNIGRCFVLLGWLYWIFAGYSSICANYEGICSSMLEKSNLGPLTSQIW